MIQQDSKGVEGTRAVVTVDGLGASGKSALARLLAERLGYAHLNSGLLYRAAALLATRAGISLDDGDGVARELRAHSVLLTHDPVLGSVARIDGTVSEAELMSREISEGASRVAKHKQVREHFLGIQRTAFAPMGVVAEGRDMGTVVFPDAPVKFFVEARLDVRAARRLQQLREKGLEGNLEEISKELKERDHRDATRVTAPMKPAPGAVIIDNSDTPLAETVERMFKTVASRP